MQRDHYGEQHRQISDGWIRASIFGMSDGLVTNVSFILGFAGASPAHSVVRLAGLASLVAGSFSMGSGEYLSMRAQKELFEYEIDVERRALKEFPDAEQQELRELFESRGIHGELAERLSADLMRDPDLALRTHAREELGIDPSATGSPMGAAIGSSASFAVGALVPLVPWLISSHGNDIIGSIVLAAIGSTSLGAAIGWFTKRGTVRWSLRQILITTLAATVTFGVGRLVGVH